MAKESGSEIESGKKKKSALKYVIYILIVLIATGISLTISLWGDNFQAVVNSFKGADWRWFAIMMGLIFASYFVEGLIILIFCRLYTRQYKFHQGVATAYIGQFYSDVTPGASGGQAMQVYTMKSQGIQVSNAASIMVMSFILYQTSLILFAIVALVVEWNKVINMTIPIEAWGWNLPLWPVIFAGFLLNISVIFLLLTMSYSRHFHNFILHYVIGFLGKIRIIKNPDGARESLRVQVENFKIELKRLASNVPVIIIQVLLYIVVLMLRFSAPYFSAYSVHATGEWFTGEYSFVNMLHVSFLASFHQMVTGLIPLPGSAGISELFYNQLFASIIQGGAGVLNSSQIMWRTATFHIILLVSGFVSAFYRSRPKEPIHYANRKTFVDLQLETYEERKRSADTLYETRQLSRKEIQRRLNELPHTHERDEDDIGMDLQIERTKPINGGNKKQKKPAAPKKPKKKKGGDGGDWEVWDI